MDQINTATLRALTKAERDRRERYAKQMDQAKKLLVDFIKRIGRDHDIRVRESVETELGLVDLTNYAIMMADEVIKRLNEAQPAHNQAQAGASEITRLQQEIQRLQAELTAARFYTQTTPDAIPPEQSRARAPTLTIAPDYSPAAETAPDPLPDGSLEERLLHLAGTSRTIRLPGLIEAGIAKLNLPEAEIEAGIQSLVSRKHLVVINPMPSFIPKSGISIPSAFSLTPQGVSAYNLKSSAPAIPVGDWLANSGQLWLEEVPLLAHFVEDVLPRYGYTFDRYLPENAVLDQDGTGPHLFVAHALLYHNGTPVQLMYAGDRYVKGGIDQYFNDFIQATKGNIHFVCLYPRTVRQVVSDLNFRASRNPTSTVTPRITNFDDVLIYEQRLRSGEIKPDENSIWFTSLRRDKK
ncbi:MAG TPA: hypothetical protein PKW33_00715 [Anaerolineaceae bacterium]|nr:hypothetical protein [Anaerolineaceae bacterium]HPN50079.1 hypothetical protein [Anaerolineaceae bacterium]